MTQLIQLQGHRRAKSVSIREIEVDKNRNKRRKKGTMSRREMEYGVEIKFLNSEFLLFSIYSALCATVCSVCIDWCWY
jgi:hypothetical protein